MNDEVQHPPVEEPAPPAETSVTAEPSRPSTAYVPIPPPNRFQRFLRRLGTWLVIVAIAFLAGLLVSGIPLYNTRKELKNTQGELNTAKQVIDAQKILLEKSSADNARISVLEALSNVRAARLALVSNDEVNVPLFLEKAAQALKGTPATLIKSQETTFNRIRLKMVQAQDKAKANLQTNKADLDKLLGELIENLRNLDEVVGSSK